MLCWEFPPRVVGGLGTACAGLARALEQKMDLMVVTPSDGYGDGYASDYGSSLKAKMEAFGDEASESVKGFDCMDVVYAHDWMTFPAAEKMARMHRVPWVAHVHSIERDRAAGGRGDLMIREIEARGLRSADRVIAVSRKTARDLVREYGVDGSKVEVVWNGVEPLRGWRVETSEKRVVFLGRMTGQKSPERFLRVAKRLVEVGQGDLRFTMAGQGDLLVKMKRLAEDLGLAEVVDFPGFLDRAAVRALLARSRVCLMTSCSEPFGLVALEAAQFGVPAVVFPNTGVQEVMGPVHVVHDENEMASVVRQMIDDEGLWRRVGEEAKREASRLTWTRAADQVLEILNKV